MKNNEDKLLKLLAISTVENPRRTIKDLAEAVGISKATLHRSYGTRENLENILREKAFEIIEDIICVAEKKFDDYEKGIKELINMHCENSEFIRFSCSFQECVEHEYWIRYTKALDSFFLNGQKNGTFRIDFDIATLTEIFISVVCGIIDAQQRGRIATTTVKDSIEKFLLYGLLNN